MASEIDRRGDHWNWGSLELQHRGNFSIAGTTTDQFKSGVSFQIAIFAERNLVAHATYCSRSAKFVFHAGDEGKDSEATRTLSGMGFP